jgi:hypothetical protein
LDGLKLRIFWERHLLRQYDIIFPASKENLSSIERLISVGRTQLVLIPNGIYLDYFTPLPGRPEAILE